MAARPAALADIVPVAGQALPYTSSEEHLWDHFARIDQLIRAQTVRWRQTIGESKPPNLWGMVHVTEAEIDGFLAAPYMPPGALPPETEAALKPYWENAEEYEDLIAARCSATPREVVLRLDRLQHLFGLSNLERDILLVPFIAELDPRYRRLYGYLQDDASLTLPNIGLILQILGPAVESAGVGWGAFDAGAPLCKRHLIVIGRGQEDQPTPMRSVRVDDRISHFLLNNDAPDSRLEGRLRVSRQTTTWNELTAPTEQIERLQGLALWWERSRSVEEAGITLLLHGPYGSGRLAAAAALCTATRTPLLIIDLEVALHSPASWVETVDIAFREALLGGAAIYWERCDAALSRDAAAHHWEYLTAAAEAFPGLCFLAAHSAWEPAGRFQNHRFLRFEFPVPGYEQRRLIWENLLPTSDVFVQPPPDRQLLAELLASGFQFTAGQIGDALVTGRGLAAQRDPNSLQLTPLDIYEGCRRQSSRHLTTMARRIEPRTQLTFDDLVLPPANQRQLEELRLRIRARGKLYSALGFERRFSLGRGLIALFTGSSGTGKTMAAELLAREQGVDLYKVDLSAIVSKWVGETEKNLNQLFADAEDANAIIFFDEADALFGKRGEIKGAQDRWANIEVNFLLQRIEEYSGVVILATNLSQNVDEAFLRRIHVIVEFPAPDAEMRFRIMRGMFPDGVRTPSDEEIREITGQVRLSGGSIRNIVIDAACRALTEQGNWPVKLSQHHLVLATAREYQKLGKPITRGDFGPAFYSWVEKEILMAG
jgi:AAA+ superfamily predicted ATPase